MHLRTVICSFSFQFPFQSSVHSWKRGTLHADEQELTSTKMYIQTRDWQEGDRRERGIGGRRMKDGVLKQSNRC